LVGCFDRAKVKNGLKIISTQTTNPAWSLSFDVNGKHIAAAVSAVRNFSVSTQPHQPRFVSVCVCRRGIVVVVLCFLLLLLLLYNDTVGLSLSFPVVYI
jgi:hypothetical protein